MTDVTLTNGGVETDASTDRTATWTGFLSLFVLQSRAVCCNSIPFFTIENAYRL